MAYDIERVSEIEVRITRGPGKPLLLLLRMASGGIGIWDRVWGDLARYFTVANFDLVGAARLEDAISPRRRFEALADRAAEVATGLGFERFHVFGWYGGCHVALACLARHGPRVGSALLLDPFYELDDMRKVEAGIAVKRALFEADRALYARYWVMAGFSPGFMERHFDTVERLAAARIEADRFVTLPPDRWLRWVRALRTNWLEEVELAAIATPTLVVATELDPWHAGPTIGMAQALVAKLGRAELQVLDGMGTFVLIEAPDLFNSKVESFLALHAA